MFTGIVEEIGTVQGIKKGEKSFNLLIRARKVLEKTILGDSICVNGVCLTVINLSENNFEAYVMAETLKRSNLGDLVLGSKVNLERALSLEGRLGGHIVSGHIDGVGEVIALAKEDSATWVTIKTSPQLLRYIVEKGSTSIDGTSLTVAYVDSEIFKVSIIPHTGEETILLSKKAGDIVNIECDVIGKYVEKLIGLNKAEKETKSSLISEEFLRSNGFL